MTSPIGNKPDKSGLKVRRQPGFTLLELILVLATLSIVLALAAPALARFFRGRGLDSEARRFLALTRYGQSRAVSEGVPMLLWIDEQQRSYGLEADRTYLEKDPRAVEIQLDDNLKLEVESPLASTLSSPWRGSGQLSRQCRIIQFTPEGFISELSPEYVFFRQVRNDEDETIVIGRSRHRLNYEIQTNQPPFLRR